MVVIKERLQRQRERIEKESSRDYYASWGVEREARGRRKRVSVGKPKTREM